MRLLGKGSLWIFFTSLLVAADIQVSSTQIVLGERLIFELSAQGNRVSFPKIENIDGERVQNGQQSSSSKSSFSDINGKITKVNTITHSQAYALYPRKSITIPSFSIKVDGKTEQTKPVKIKLISQEELDKQIPFSLRFDVNKKSIYVGEMAKFTLSIKISDRIGAKDVRLGKSILDGLDVEPNPKQSVAHENGYMITKLEFWAKSLKEGNISVNPSEVHLGFASQREDFFSMLSNPYEYKTIRSNELPLEVKPLPKGVSAVGDFKIKASVDKSQVEAGKPVNLTLSIQGEGSLSELGKLKSSIENVNSYADKPKLSTQINKNSFQSKWSQKIAYVGQSDFTIEPFVFSYLDGESGKIKTIKTKPFKIKVNGSLKPTQTVQKSSIEMPKQEKIIVKNLGFSWLWAVFIFFLGLSAGYALSFAKKPSMKKPKIFKNQKELLQELLALKGKNEELDGWIKKLELNVYEGKNKKIDNKQIQKILKG